MYISFNKQEVETLYFNNDILFYIQPYHFNGPWTTNYYTLQIEMD